MAEYIDKERAKKRLISDYAYAAARILDELPAADVVEVKHGQWKALPFVPAAGIPTAEAICSECGRDVVYQVVDDRYMFENYCPHCGAKMDKGGADNG